MKKIIFMKKKHIFLALIISLFAAGSIINMHLAENSHNMDISLADISVMAQADGESAKPNECYKLENHTCYDYLYKLACFHMVEPVTPPYSCDVN